MLQRYFFRFRQSNMRYFYVSDQNVVKMLQKASLWRFAEKSSLQTESNRQGCRCKKGLHVEKKPKNRLDLQVFKHFSKHAMHLDAISCESEKLITQSG